MSFKTNLIPEYTLNLISSLALAGYEEAAINELHKLELSKEQKQKITVILQNPLTAHTTDATQTLHQRITTVIIGEEIAINSTSATTPNEQGSSSLAAHVVPSAQQQYVSFTDTSTSPFAMAHPCTFEFNGKHYQNATACFLAQQYTDQPEVFDRFTSLNSEEATTLAELTPMTKKRKLSWENPSPMVSLWENPSAMDSNKDAVLTEVQRAKFEQNPELKEELLSTGGAYLVCQGYGFYLSDNFNGTGNNALGASLMRLRGEFGGMGLVEPPTSIQSLQMRSSTIQCEIPSDIMEILFNHCMSLCNWNTITKGKWNTLTLRNWDTLTVLPCVNKHWDQCATNFWKAYDRKDICTPELTIIDAKAEGVECDDEPKTKTHEILKRVKKLASQVEGDAGVTLLTITKGSTLEQLKEIAKKTGITFYFSSPRFSSDEILKKLEKVPVEKTYKVLIANNVFIGSRNKYAELQDVLVNGNGCEMPTDVEYAALCVFTNKIFKKCLYAMSAKTMGRSSTKLEGSFLTVSCTPTQIYCTFNNVPNEPIGAGGRLKL